jgi:hypothetical protein
MVHPCCYISTASYHAGGALSGAKRKDLNTCAMSGRNGGDKAQKRGPDGPLFQLFSLPVGLADLCGATLREQCLSVNSYYGFSFV